MLIMVQTRLIHILSRHYYYDYSTIRCDWTLRIAECSRLCDRFKPLSHTWQVSAEAVQMVKDRTTSRRCLYSGQNITHDGDASGFCSETDWANHYHAHHHVFKSLLESSVANISERHIVSCYIPGKPSINSTYP